ncbi:MAG: hypothetical protein K6D96_09310 [Acetatifactor sp.]|nr:hypothetical protein [Acetatifactor sp.]
MKKKMLALLLSVSFIITACGSNAKEQLPDEFTTSMNDFCTQVSIIDDEINGIDPESEGAVDDLLSYLDELKVNFDGFAELDFPEEFDYLESLADESADYMTQAVDKYHEAYGNEGYNEYTVAYAKEYYSRAYKRLQIIISFLHGETPDDADVVITNSDGTQKTGEEINDQTE